MIKPPLLEIDNLTIGFQAYGQYRRVLHNVSLTVGVGERVSLIGQSGSGKTVTMRTIIGTLPMPPGVVEAGAIRYDGRSLLDLNRIERNKLKGTGISIVLQDPMLSFNPVLTIGRQMDDIVRYADARLGKRRTAVKRRDHIVETLGKVQLSEGARILDSYPIMLSGGMRQRVLIGMALLNKPRLLIADEPGTALDVTTQDEILDLLNHLVAKEGLSLLLITHNLGVVREMADRVYVMDQGRIVETGSRDAIFSAPKHDYTKRLMAAVPPLYGPGVVTMTNERKGSDAAISIEAVSKDFLVSKGFFNQTKTAHRAVDNITINVQPGDIFGLAGESGSGKTTLAKMTLGLIDPTAGRIFVNGQDVARIGRTSEFRKLIQIVYQNPGSSLNPRRTITDQIAVPLKFTGHKANRIKSRVCELLEMVDLPADMANMYPHELSGGQKQRVAIARALSVNPSILVLDEPTSALDVLVQSTVIELLHRLRIEFDLTYLFISHDLSLMRNFCNRVGVMLRGQIVEEGSVEQVFSSPNHAYTRALLSAIPVTTDAADALKPRVSKEERAAVLNPSTAIGG
ncbi:peptide ABC-transporter ATP-binding protein [Octadecabacter antarcticus 307]|uniref:Peptide ABC-transporter ATP-binding protein n=1 Tax=Octadecabacter antarcticus 307 TaxID=391626 RepID=M9R8Y3_9RHOB|nr:ABC transporter ATP-binding protein [Octadecabacter antarcticus]AGI66791.1 peptide ABC-transporter ATP-binding protein [Octadecabacter antarcticus 307]